MKDFIGQPLAVGDRVIFMQRGYRTLLTGKIVSMSPQMCFIEHRVPTSWNPDYRRTTRQFFEQVIRHPVQTP